jgi:hypothetical protein
MTLYRHGLVAAVVIAFLLGLAAVASATPTATATSTPTGSKTATSTLTSSKTATPTSTSTSTASSTSSSASATSSPTSSPAPAGTGAGVYQIGRDLQAGLYRTSGPPASKDSCWWERLSANDGEIKSIIAMDSVDGPSSMTVATTDKFVQFIGPCRWVRDAAAPPPATGSPGGAITRIPSSGDSSDTRSPGTHSPRGGYELPQGGVETGG